MQSTLASSDFDLPRKPTRKELFLSEMDKAVPWKRLCALIGPHYPKAGNGRPPLGLERMLRVHFLQHWYDLSDITAEEALIDMPAMRRFAGFDLGRERAPDATTILKFRRIIEDSELGKAIFKDVAGMLADEKGLAVSRGTMVDATFIDAPRSTRNRDRARDPDMAWGRKGTDSRFGLKAHVGSDSKSRVIHAITVTPANVHDSQVVGDLLHGDETRVWGDSAYTGQREAIRRAAPGARDFTHERGARGRKLTERQRERNRFKSRTRAKVEHVFAVMKHIFGYAKVRYRGLAKNANKIFTKGALVNIYIVRKQLLRMA